MKGATRSITAWLAVAAMVTLVLACKQVVPAPAPVDPPAPTPEEPPAPKPTLLGTWEIVTEWEDDDGDVRPVTIRLVFSGSGKAYWHVDQLELSGEDRHEPYGHIAGWSATKDTITKTYIHDDDDDGQWQSATIDKSYYLSDSGSVLLVHPWDSDETEDTFERYARVQDPVPSNPTLLGTWEAKGVYHEHDDLTDDYFVAGRKRLTLTFTENRYILVETPRDGNEVVAYWPSSGTWTLATESSVAKTFVAERHRDDDGNWTFETRSFDKEYAWAAGGELFVMEWRGDWEDAGDAANPHIERYTRVETPLPPLAGVWMWQDEGERDGQVVVDRVTLTIGDSFTWLFEREVGGERELWWSLSGSSRHDAEKQFLFVDVQDAVITNLQWPPEEVDERVDRWTRQYKGHELRFGYAPAGVRDEMVISWAPNERTYDPDTNQWTESEIHPHGGYYWRPFVKQP